LDEPTRLSTLAKLEEVTLYIGESTKPPRFALVEADIPMEFKACALKKYNAVRASKDGDHAKYSQWLSLFREIPFGKYCHLPVTIADGSEKCHEFMSNAKKQLDDSTFGLDDAKLQLMQYIGQLIANPSAAGTSIAIQGPMGTGKTTLIKEGLGKILQRPCVLIALGGNNDGSTFKGHSITYEASIPGKIATSLMKSRCMNPIFFFDELDKVSDTPKGEEIIGILTHLTDSTQNTKFHDEYFADIDFDLSKALFVFSYNDAGKIRRAHPILRDRMYEVQTKGYSPTEKAIIAKKYLLKAIRDNVKFDEAEVTFSDEAISFIIDHHTEQEQGVRNLKRCLETIFAKLNLFRLMRVTDIPLKVEFPYVVTAETVRALLKQDLPPAYTHMYC
jgi:ATP-dependent Lon protease